MPISSHCFCPWLKAPARVVSRPASPIVSSVAAIERCCAAVVNLSKSFFTQAFPEYWLFFLGALFVAVTLWLPDGIVGLFRRRREVRT